MLSAETCETKCQNNFYFRFCTLNEMKLTSARSHRKRNEKHYFISVDIVGYSNPRIASNTCLILLFYWYIEGIEIDIRRIFKWNIWHTQITHSNTQINCFWTFIDKIICLFLSFFRIVLRHLASLHKTYWTHWDIPRHKSVSTFTYIPISISCYVLDNLLLIHLGNNLLFLKSIKLAF